MQWVVLSKLFVLSFPTHQIQEDPGRPQQSHQWTVLFARVREALPLPEGQLSTTSNRARRQKTLSAVHYYLQTVPEPTVSPRGLIVSFHHLQTNHHPEYKEHENRGETAEVLPQKHTQQTSAERRSKSISPKVQLKAGHHKAVTDSNRVRELSALDVFPCYSFNELIIYLGFLYEKSLS